VLELTRGVVAADDPRLGAAMNNLAAVYREQGRYELAMPLFEQAIEIQRRHGEPGLAAAALNNLALLHDEQGDRERAKALYEEALDATRRLLGDAHPQVATVLNNLAEVHRESGSIQDALRLQREANERFERAFGEWHPSLSRGLLNLAKTLARAGRLTEALDAQLRSARIDDRTLAQVLPLGSERQRAHYMESVVSPLYATLSLVAQQQERSRAGIPETFDLVLRRKALGAEALTAQREAILEGGDPELLARLRQLVALKARSSRSALAGGDADEGEREAIETELARALAEFLFDDEHAMVRIDMSEYMEKHAVARLIGAPPGYVGYEEGGQLTEAVRRRPYSVILFDEIEKAHPDVFNVLLQIMDDGRLTDGKGRTVDFKNTVIIMTSNLGAQFLQSVTLEDREVFARAGERVMEALRAHFRPEFLNRVDDIIIFNPLGKEQLTKIVELRLEDVRRLLADRNITIELTDAARELLFAEGYDPAFGARPLKRAIQRLIQDPLALKILDGEVLHGDHVVIDADKRERRMLFKVERGVRRAKRERVTTPVA
jgi:tetratricopeptide (TPR) repeat protein